MRIIKQGERLGAIGFFVVHLDAARTSGPGADELRFTRELRRTGEDFDLYLLDHLIVTRDRLIEVAAY